MKQIWKNKWLMLLGGVIFLGGLSGCEDRPEGAVPFPEGEEVIRLFSSVAGSAIRTSLLLFKNTQ